MKKSWILVIDSGMGGLWTLKKIQKILPNENYLFFMDKIHSPYGNKSKRQLLKIAENIVLNTKKYFSIKAVVLACNTLSSVAYDFLMNKFFDTPILKINPFVDIKFLKNLPTLVLATNNTIKNNTDLKKYNNINYIHMHGFGTLAKKIDKNMHNLDVLIPFLSKKLKKYKNFQIKNVLLGCTHFNYIKPQLKKIFGDVNFFENSENVSFSLKKVLKSKHKISKQKQTGKTIILFKI